ncbi:MAG: hypothetical protein HN416_15065 [Nitrospina sp.]|jgi:hypothetical protein|nr:hypothetical protein [Nitrospina sp.]
MEEVVDILCLRLQSKGLVWFEISDLISDIYEILGVGCDPTAAIINGELSRLGWRELIIDEQTLNLIVSFLKNSGCLEVARSTVH